MPRILYSALILLFAISSQAAEKPNIVFILADDMGYGDLKPFNPKSRILTPNLDELARAGMPYGCSLWRVDLQAFAVCVAHGTIRRSQEQL